MKKHSSEIQNEDLGSKSIIFNVINKKMDEAYKYYDYKNTLRTFLEKKCFTKDSAVLTYENFHNNYSEYLDLKVSVAIDRLKGIGNPIYKELLLNKSFEELVCTFSLDKKIKNLSKPGYLELICDGKRVFRKKHCKDVSKSILNIMKIKGSGVLFNGNANYVNNNLEIAKSNTAYFKVSF